MTGASSTTCVKVRARLAADSVAAFYDVDDKREFTATVRDGDGSLWDVYIVDLLTCWEDVLLYYLPPRRFDLVMADWADTEKAIARAARYAALRPDSERRAILAVHRGNLPYLLRRLRKMISCSNIRFYPPSRTDKGVDLKARGGHGRSGGKKVLAGAGSPIRRGSRGRGCGGIG